MDANHSVEVEGGALTMPGRDVVLFPDVVSNRVEIVFGSGELSKENISSAIQKYTDDSFVIEAFEDRDGATVVIIRFEDVDCAKKFVRDVSSASRDTDGFIKKVNFVEIDNSFSSAIVPLSVLLYFLYSF